MEMTAEDIDRYWSKVAIGEPDECWEWQAFRTKGYGKFKLNGKMERAHRVSYELEVGPIPEGQQVLHTCDNPACQNPGHFFLGDDAKNVADKVEKERQARGSTIVQAKLTEDQVAEIRLRTERRYHGMYVEMATEYGVSSGTIESVVHGDTWRHVRVA